MTIMTKTLFIAAIVTLAATSAWAQSARSAENIGNPAVDRSGAKGSTGVNDVQTDFATAAKARAAAEHPLIATVPYSDNQAGLGAGGSSRWRGPYQPR